MYVCMYRQHLTLCVHTNNSVYVKTTLKIMCTDRQQCVRKDNARPLCTYRQQCVHKDNIKNNVFIQTTVYM